MVFQTILLIFLLGGALIGGLVAYRKPWLERVILFATIPVAWLMAMLVLKGGAADSVGQLVLSLLQNNAEMAQLLAEAPAAVSGAAALINSFVRVLVMVPVFLVILVVLRVVYAIVKGILKLKENKLFQPADKTDIIKNLGAAAIGFVGAFAICMLMLMPIHFVTDLLAPTMETFEDEKYDGTYMSAMTEEMGVGLLPLASKTPCGALQSLTGLRAAMNGTANTLCTVSFETKTGQTVTFNARATLRTLIKDGALGLTLYEYTCNPQKHTVGDFALAADVIEDLSSQEFLVAVAQEILVSVETQEEPQPVSAQEDAEQDETLRELLASLAEAYKTAEPAVLQSDIRAVAELLRVITTDLGETPLNKVELQELLFDYLTDEEAAYRVVTALSKIHVYGEVLTGLTEYGMNMLGDILKISADRAEHHDKLLLELQQVLSDRSIGSYDAASVEIAIRHLAETGNASDLPENVRQAYERYMTRSEKLLKVLDTYTGNGSGKPYFVGESGVYVLDELTDTWSLYTGSAMLDRGSYLGQLLLENANAMLDADENAVLDEGKLLNMVSSISQQLQNGDVLYASNCRLLADSITNENSEHFAPEAIYRQDLTESLKKDVVFDEAQNRQFAVIVTTAADLFAQLMSGEDLSVDTIMDYFPQVGRLLDGLTGFEMTSRVSGVLLQALMQSGEFGSYFSADSVKSLVENVQKGTTTYEQLFRTVQSLYNILNQLAPLG